MTAPAQKRALRAVEPDEKAPVQKRTAKRTPPKPKTVAEAAAKGSRRDLMVAMRDRIALAVSDPKCPPRDLASLTRRLDAIAAEIESIDLRAQEEGSESDAADDDTFDPASV